MSSQRSTRSVTCCSVGLGRPGRWTAPRRAAPAPPPRAPRPARRGRRARAGEVDATARAHRRRGAGRAGVGARSECTHGSAPASRDRVEHPLERPPRPRAGGRCGAGRSRTRSGPARRARRPAPARRPARRSSAPGQPAAHVGDVVAHALGQRLGELAPGAVVGEHLVAARLLDRGGQRPRSGDLDLERARSQPCACSSSVSRSWASSDGPGAGRPRGVGEPPAGGLQVGAEPGDHAPARGRSWSAAAPRPGSSGRCGRSGSSPSTIRTASA